MFKFLHTADLHLDSPQLNLDQYDGAPTHLRNPTRRALDKIVELAIDEGVQFLLIAGDLYDGDCRNFQTPLHFFPAEDG
jgi:DNA repair exonuclease SbcCD nuclease subunit